MSSDLIQDGVIRNLQTLAESSQRLSDRIKERYPEVDWKGLSGFRNVLVHDYLGVDLDQIYRVVEKDVPKGRTRIASGARMHNHRFVGTRFAAEPGWSAAQTHPGSRV